MKKLLLLTAICVPIFYAQSSSPISTHDSEQEQEEIIDNPHFLVSAGVGLGGSSNKTSHYSIPFGVESEYLLSKTPIGFSAGIGVVEDFSSFFSTKAKVLGFSFSLLEGPQITGMGAVNMHLKADDINSPFISVQYMPTTKILWGQNQDETLLFPDITMPTPQTSKVPKDIVAITFNVRKQRFQFGIGLSEPLKIEKGKFIEETRFILNTGVCF